MFPPQLIVGFNSATNIPLFLRLLPNIEKMLRRSADLLLPWSDILDLFTRPENHRGSSAATEADHSYNNNKQSHSHETWQGICLCRPSQADPLQKADRGLLFGQRSRFFVRSSLR